MQVVFEHGPLTRPGTQAPRHTVLAVSYRDSRTDSNYWFLALFTLVCQKETDRYTLQSSAATLLELLFIRFRAMQSGNNKHMECLLAFSLSLSPRNNERQSTLASHLILPLNASWLLASWRFDRDVTAKSNQSTCPFWPRCPAQGSVKFHSLESLFYAVFTGLVPVQSSDIYPSPS